MLLLCGLFYSILCDLFYSALLYTLHSILLYSTLLYTLFYSTLLYSTLYSILLYFFSMEHATAHNRSLSMHLSIKTVTLFNGIAIDPMLQVSNGLQSSTPYPFTAVFMFYQFLAAPPLLMFLSFLASIVLINCINTSFPCFFFGQVVAPLF